MSERNDGGPAFPVLRQHFSGDVMGSAGGMSLRDWIAGQALAGLLSNSGMYAQYSGHVGLTPPEFKSEVAAAAYLWADAMLKARGRPV